MKSHAKFCLTLALLAAPGFSALAAGLPYTFSSGAPARAEEVNANFRYVAPPNIVYVNPVPGGTAQDNGAALLDALNLANLTAINGAPSTTNSYLIKVAPGVYDVGSVAAALPQYVHVEGSGGGRFGPTMVRGQIGSGGLFTLALSSSISRLTVANTATTGTPVGISAGSGVMHTEVRDVTILTTGTAQCVALLASDGAKISAYNVTVSTTQSGGAHTAVSSTGAGTEIKLNNANIDMWGYGGTDVRGIRATSGGKVVARNVAITAYTTTSGVRVQGVTVPGPSSEVTIQDGHINVYGGVATDRYPLYIDSADSRITVNHSTLLNGTGTVSDNFLYVGTSGGIVRVGASHLGSQYYNAPGSTGINVKCAYVYDTDYTQIGDCVQAIQ